MPTKNQSKGHSFLPSTTLPFVKAHLIAYTWLLGPFDEQGTVHNTEVAPRLGVHRGIMLAVGAHLCSLAQYIPPLRYDRQHLLQNVAEYLLIFFFPSFEQ